MTGWLGDAYLWVKAGHVVFVIFWIAGMFMLPRYLAYHAATPPGTSEDRLWIAREAKIMRIVINPAMGVTWIFGLMLAAHWGFQGGWLHAKLLLVLLLSGYHGWLSATRRKFANGGRPYSERTLRMLNEVPAIATILIVILVIVKPF